MSKDITITLSKEIEEFLIKRSQKNQISVEDTIIQLINEQQNRIITFKEGFYYDRLKNSLFDKNNKKIKLTNLQNGLFNTLLRYEGEIVEFNTIHKEVWKNKKMSIFTMRNIVKRIRDLSYYGIIKNHSNKGYSLGDTL